MSYFTPRRSINIHRKGCLHAEPNGGKNRIFFFFYFFFFLSFFLSFHCIVTRHHINILSYSIRFSFRSNCAKAQPFSSFVKRFREPHLGNYYAYMHSAMDATPINQVLNNESIASMHAWCVVTSMVARKLLLLFIANHSNF